MDLFSGSFGLLNSFKKEAKIVGNPEDKVKIWVLRCARTGRVHYMEAYKDFVDLLLGLMMLRVGAVIRLNRAVLPAMKQVMTLGGVFGVYESFKSLEDDLVIIDKDILLDPLQSVKVSDELHSLESSDFECCNADCSKYISGSRQICRRCSVATHYSCITCGGYFQENAHTSLCYTPWRPWKNHMTAAPILTRYTVVHSSPPTAKIPKKEGYVKTNVPYIITNELNITPLNTFNVSEVLKNCGGSHCDDLECYELSIGRKEILVMVCAALTSSTPLTDIFGKMCNKETRISSTATASFCLLPSFRKKSDKKSESQDHHGCSPRTKGTKKSDKKSESQDHHECSPSTKGTTDLNDKQDNKNQKDKQCKKNENDLPKQAPNLLPPRLQLEEQIAVRKPPPRLQLEEQITVREPPEYVLRDSKAASFKPPEYVLKGSELTMKEPNEQILQSKSFEEQPIANMAPKPQPSCLGLCSSKQKKSKSPELTPQRVSFQKQPAAIETGIESPETKPSCFRFSSSPERSQLPEPTPTQSSSFQRQRVFDHEPEPRAVESESSFVEISNPRNSPRQSILMGRRFRDSAVSTESHPINNMKYPAQRPSVPPDQVGQKAVLTKTPTSTTLIRSPEQFSSPRSLPTLSVRPKSQSILNPLFRERPPSGVSSRSSQRRASPTASIVHRSLHGSYPRQEAQPKIKGVRQPARFGKNFAGNGLGSLTSIAALAFEQAPPDCPSCSDDESTASDGSDGSVNMN